MLCVRSSPLMCDMWVNTLQRGIPESSDVCQSCRAFFTCCRAAGPGADGARLHSLKVFVSRAVTHRQGPRRPSVEFELKGAGGSAHEIKPRWGLHRCNQATWPNPRQQQKPTQVESHWAELPQDTRRWISYSEGLSLYIPCRHFFVSK